jgi:hypothetical protein
MALLLQQAHCGDVDLFQQPPLDSMSISQRLLDVGPRSSTRAAAQAEAAARVAAAAASSSAAAASTPTPAAAPTAEAAASPGRSVYSPMSADETTPDRPDQRVAGISSSTPYDAAAADDDQERQRGSKQGIGEKLVKDKWTPPDQKEGQHRQLKQGRYTQEAVEADKPSASSSSTAGGIVGGSSSSAPASAIVLPAAQAAAADSCCSLGAFVEGMMALPDDELCAIFAEVNRLQQLRLLKVLLVDGEKAGIKRNCYDTAVRTAYVAVGQSVPWLQQLLDSSSSVEQAVEQLTDSDAVRSWPEPGFYCRWQTRKDECSRDNSQQLLVKIDSSYAVSPEFSSQQQQLRVVNNKLPKVKVENWEAADPNAHAAALKVIVAAVVRMVLAGQAGLPADLQLFQVPPQLAPAAAAGSVFQRNLNSVAGRLEGI